MREGEAEAGGGGGGEMKVLMMGKKVFQMQQDREVLVSDINGKVVKRYV